MSRGWFAFVILVATIGTRPAIANPSLGLAEPIAPPIGEVLETETSPAYYRLPPDVVTFASRSSLGTQTWWDDDDRDTAFALDLLAGAAVRFGRDARTGLWIEGGYSWINGHAHLAVLGVGPAYRTRGMFGTLIALVPHVVAGRVEGQTAIGARTSLVASLGAYGIELAHQVTFSSGDRSDEMHVAFTMAMAGGR